MTKNDALTDELNKAQEYVRLKSAARAAASFVMPANSEPEMFAGSWLEEQKSQHE